MTGPRVAVTNAIATYMNGAGVISLSNVFPYPAKFTPEGEFYEGEDPGTQDGALIFMRLGTQRSKRIELRGMPPGGKMMQFELTLTIIHRSSKQKTQAAGADNDELLDSLITAIEADKNAGAPGIVFSWGEGGITGGEDLQLETFYPRPIKAGVTQTNSRLLVQVLHQTT